MTKEEVKDWVEALEKEECIKKDNTSSIKFEENNKKVLFLNSSRKDYYRIQVDGCLITEGVRCDCILLDSENGRTFYVELKGGDTKHAIEQLKSTATRICPCKTCQRFAMVIGKNHLPRTSGGIQISKKHFNDLGIDLMVLNSVVRYDLSDGSYQENL